MVSPVLPNALEKRTRICDPPTDRWTTCRSVQFVNPGAGGMLFVSASSGEDAHEPTQCVSFSEFLSAFPASTDKLTTNKRTLAATAPGRINHFSACGVLRTFEMPPCWPSDADAYSALDPGLHRRGPSLVLYLTERAIPHIPGQTQTQALSVGVVRVPGFRLPSTLRFVKLLAAPRQDSKSRK